MADKAPPQTDQQPAPLNLSTGDVVGAIQRLAGELDRTLWEVPPHQVTSDLVYAFLARMAEFGAHLPAQQAQQAANPDGTPLRKAS